ncbi:phosphate/phosphite/phosphonate ABC transporter substrate-binding protein [Armatimonas sp.]|uniref:phosphate/phosphite/phosphonate ABC transporter substrate-binding protein n=1 Tax=Armatimonas sp. TaxID=1872638 RepID=UPI0037530DC9
MNQIRRRALFFATALTLTSFALVGCNPSSDKGTGTTAAPVAEGTAPAKLILGFVPSVEADKAVANAKPLADYLSAELGIPVESFVSTDYVGLIEAMASKKVDIGSLPTLGYVLAKDKNAAEVILKTAREIPATKEVKTTYHSMFITRADSGIKSIEEAKGKRMAFVDPASASGNLFPRYYLKKKNIDPDNFFAQTMFAGSHDGAVRAVYNGQVDVAAVYDDARNKVEKTLPDVKTRVIKIGETDEIPNDTIAVRAGLNTALVEKIKAAFLKYSKTDEGKKALKAIYEVEGFSEATNADYDVVRDVAKALNVPLDNYMPKPKSAATPAPAPAGAPKK